MENKPPELPRNGGAKHAGPPKLTEEERRQYDEIHERSVARLKQQSKGRRSRWRPPES